MKITIESTEKVVTLNGIPARIWEGATEKGVPVVVFVTRIGVPLDGDQTDFQRELQECRPLSPEMKYFPVRLSL